MNVATKVAARLGPMAFEQIFVAVQKRRSRKPHGSSLEPDCWTRNAGHFRFGRHLGANPMQCSRSLVRPEAIVGAHRVCVLRITRFEDVQLNEDCAPLGFEVDTMCEEIVYRDSSDI
jgi:hypothetical protein